MRRSTVLGLAAAAALGVAAAGAAGWVLLAPNGHPAPRTTAYVITVERRPEPGGTCEAGRCRRWVTEDPRPVPTFLDLAAVPPSRPALAGHQTGTLLEPGYCLVVVRAPARLTLVDLDHRLGAAPGTTHLFDPDSDDAWWTEIGGVLTLPPRLRAAELTGAWVLWSANDSLCSDEAWLRRASSGGARVIAYSTNLEAPAQLAVAVDGRVTDRLSAEDLADPRARVAASGLLRPYLPGLRKAAAVADLDGMAGRVLQELGGVRLDAAWLRGPMWAVEGAHS